jgi:hypothetical protein
LDTITVVVGRYFLVEVNNVDRRFFTHKINNIRFLHHPLSTFQYLHLDLFAPDVHLLIVESEI